MEPFNKRECSRIDFYKRKEINNKHIINDSFEPWSSTASSSKSSKNVYLLPNFVEEVDKVTKSLIVPDLVHIIAKLDNTYVKYRTMGPKMHRLNLPISQFMADAFERIRLKVCPAKFESKNEKCEFFKILADYNRHRIIIKQIVESYFNKFIDNSWNFKKYNACVIIYILLRMLNNLLYEDIYNLLTEIAPVFKVLPLVHFLLNENHFDTNELSMFGYDYARSMFTTSSTKGKTLLRRLYNELLFLYFEEYHFCPEMIKQIPFNLLQLLDVTFKEFFKNYDGTIESLGISQTKRHSQKMLKKTLNRDTLMNFPRLITLTKEDKILYSPFQYLEYREDEDEDVDCRSEYIVEKKDSDVKVETQPKDEKTFQHQKPQETELIMGVLNKFREQPWALSENERQLIIQLENERGWFSKDDYPDSASILEEQKLKESTKKGPTQRRGMELAGTKNRCCIQQLEEENIESPKLFQREKKSLNYMKKEIDFRKNNASVLREAASITKEECEILAEIKELECGDIGLLQYKKAVLESQIKDATDEELEKKKKHLLVLLSTERAICARNLIKQKNVELRALHAKEAKILEEEKKSLCELEKVKKKKLVEEIQEERQKIQEKIQLLHLDNWIEARFIKRVFEKMKADQKAKREEELLKKKDEIEIKRTLKYLQPKKDVLNNPLTKDPLWQVKQPGLPSVAASLELKFVKAKAAEELKRKKEAIFETNTRRKCLKKCAEDYIQSRRLLRQKKKEIEQETKLPTPQITIQSKEINELEQELKFYKELRKKKKPITVCPPRPIEHTVAPIVDDCLYKEELGIFLKKIRQPTKANVQSDQLAEINKEIKKKRALLTDYSTDSIKFIEEVEKIKVPPPITSLDTYFDNVFTEVNWGAEDDEMSDDERMKQKLISMGQIYSDYKLFQNSDKIPEIIPVSKATSLPIIMAGDVHANVFRKADALIRKKPFYKDKEIINAEILNNMMEIVKLYSTIKNKVFKKDKFQRLKSFFTFLGKGEQTIDDESYDPMFTEQRRFLMLPKKEKARHPKFSHERTPQESSETTITDSSSIKQKINRDLSLSLRRKGKKVALIPGIVRQFIKKSPSVSKTTGRKSESEKAFWFSSTGRSESLLLDDDSSHDDIEGLSGHLTEGELAVLRISEGESFIMPDMKKIDDFDDTKELLDEKKLPDNYKTVLQFLEMPVDVSSFSLLAGKSFTSLELKKEEKLLKDFSDSISKLGESRKIPSSTALEYILKMHSHDESLKKIQKHEGSLQTLAVPKLGALKKFRGSMRMLSLEKLQKVLNLPKIHPLTKKYGKKLLSVNRLSRNIETMGKEIRFNTKDYTKQYLNYLKTLPHKNLGKPKVYPPFKLNLSQSAIERLGYTYSYRYTKGRLILPGNFRYIQQKHFVIKPRKKRKISSKSMPSQMSERAKCLQEKFTAIDRLLVSKFPPPYSVDSLLLEYFPSLNKAVSNDEHNRLYKSLKQKSSLPMRNIQNSYSNQEENIVMVPALPSPLGAKTNSDTESNSCLNYCSEIPDLTQTPTKYKSDEDYGCYANLNSHPVMNESSYPLAENNILKNKLIIKNNSDFRTKKFVKNCSSYTDKSTLKHKFENILSNSSSGDDTNSMKCYQYFSLPLKTNRKNLNMNVKPIKYNEQNETFLPFIKSRSFIKESRPTRDTALKLPPIKKNVTSLK